jgi:hypothetical protein
MSAIPFLTIAEIKEPDGILKEIQAGNDSEDGLLTALIASFSGFGEVGQLSGAEHYCNRIFSKGTYTEYFNSDGDTKRLKVLAYPVTAITGIWIDTDRLWGDGTEMVLNDYFPDMRGQPWIHANNTIFSPAGQQHIKVTYTGGRVTATSTADTALKLACQFQVAFWWRNRNRLGLITEGMEGGSYTRFAKGEFLPEVKLLLDPFKRF